MFLQIYPPNANVEGTFQAEPCNPLGEIRFMLRNNIQLDTLKWIPFRTQSVFS